MFSGLGLISSLPVVSESVQFLTIHKHDPDTNQRIVLHVALQINPKTVLNLVLIHLSYQRQQQCKNMAEILRFITGIHSSPDKKGYQRYFKDN